ncbi:MAG: 3-deoxy-D-manno-octulosonic acid transferase [Planctomycetaceae bacterium]|jgi:3-deoxy-D-manno-octulosonic-acid transferase|nr:3-deoxy-D-manno-octulosonic acid transferase [Planctomycetaceae bacterium]
MFRDWFFNLIYIVILVVFSPLLFYRALKQGKYRSGFKQKYFGRIPRRRHVLAKAGSVDFPDTKVVWFHAVSVGEVNLLRPLLKLIRESQRDWHCVVSTTSLTGMELAVKLFGEELTVFYCPLDFSWAVDKAMQRLRPDLLVLAEQELWPNLIHSAKRYGSKVAIINGRLSENGYKKYLWIRRFIAPMFRQIDKIAVQSETYAGWFHRLGVSVNSIQVIGSMKFDGAKSDRHNPETQHLKKLAGISEDDIVFLAGSTQSPEEKYAIDCYEHLKVDFPRLRLILVPRHSERFEEVAALLEHKAVFWQRRSKLCEVSENGGRNTEKSSFSDSGIDTVSVSDSGILAGESSNKSVTPRILLVDTIGELGGWWGTASIAFVGGSMGKRGGQNMIEPAAYGAAVCFGPNTQNFRDIVDLILRDEAAQVVHDQYEMEQFVRHCLETPEMIEQFGDRAKKLVERQLGATKRTLEMLEKLL